MRSNRLATLLVLPLIAGALCGLPAVKPEWTDPTHAFLQQESTFEQFQWPWYVASAAVLAHARRTAEQPGRDVLLWLLWVFAFLGWREFDLDRTLYLERWYNPWLYLGNPAIPASGQVLMSCVAVAFVGSLAWLAVRRPPDVRAWIAERDLRVAGPLAALAVLSMVGALACDKYRTIRKHLDLDLAFPERIYAEEALELFAAATLFFAALDIASQERRHGAER